MFGSVSDVELFCPGSVFGSTWSGFVISSSEATGSPRDGQDQIGSFTPGRKANDVVFSPSAWIASISIAVARMSEWSKTGAGWLLSIVVSTPVFSEFTMDALVEFPLLHAARPTSRTAAAGT